MQKNKSLSLNVLYSLIFISGASGLICQVVWHKYLSILLGAEARATAIVLAIFLGGIGLGYALLGKNASYKKWNLLKAYTLLEIGLGFYAFFFPVIFEAINPLSSLLYQWFGFNNIFTDIIVSIVLIGFPTILMGGTLPVLTQGLSRSIENSSQTHARIYGFNTVGACVGALLAGYYLIPTTDFAFSLLIAGIGNLVVAFCVYFFYAKRWQPIAAPIEIKKVATSPLSRAQKYLLVIAFLSGFYVLTMETVFIRLMGLSMGSSGYNFTLIIAIFVLGLGMGSLVARRINQYSPQALLRNQVLILVGLSLVYLTVPAWSYVGHLIRISISTLPQTFYLFHFAISFFLFFVLAIPIGLCGLTLPICFHLFKEQQGNLAHKVGQLYSVNTVGCVLGALVGGYGLFYFFNLDGIYKICLLLIVLSSLLSLQVSYLLSNQKVNYGGKAFLLTLPLAIIVSLPHFPGEAWIQAFRLSRPNPGSFNGVEGFHRFLTRSSKILHRTDGPNTSVTILKSNGSSDSISLLVNGKSDGNSKGDGPVFIRTAHVPALLAEQVKNVAVIGLGTGITAGEFTRYPELERVDVLEISKAVIDSAPYFDAFTNGVSHHPKVNLLNLDAFRFFEANNIKYDIIASEPSNPWVTGVENLFTEHFYSTAKKHLSDRGIFAQWVQTYSFNPELMGMVLSGIKNHFKNVSVFRIGEADLLLIATDFPLTQKHYDRVQVKLEKSPELQAVLAKHGLASAYELALNEEFDHLLLEKIIDSETAHQIDSPRLSYGAAKARFLLQQFDTKKYSMSFREYYGTNSLGKQFILEKTPTTQELATMMEHFCIKNVLPKSQACTDAAILSSRFAPALLRKEEFAKLLVEENFQILGAFYNPVPRVFGKKELKQTEAMYNFYRKYYRPTNLLSSDKVVERLDVCLSNPNQKTSLYGNCLLSKVMIFNQLKLPHMDTRNVAGRYLDWFSVMPSQLENYENFEKAADDARKIVQGQKVVM